MSDIARTEVEHHHSHRDVTGGWLRPAVFGAMDGLISNSSLMAGVAGGAASSGAGNSTVILAGLAGLAAGAFSMAAGEYVSVASQSELARAEIENERREIALRPDAERAEMVALWEYRGLSRPLAEQVADQLALDPDKYLAAHAREELGVTLDDLPNPWTAASSSFLAFALGALLPVLPYLLGATGFRPSLIVALTGLFLVGAAVANLTERPWWYGGIRQFVVGSVAMAATWGFGTIVGHSI
jgi:VIT1/CCC1 family predicted Fe2+/Mn2+ transporter